MPLLRLLAPVELVPVLQRGSPAESGNAVAGKVQTSAAKKTKVVSPRPDTPAAAPAEGGPPPSTDEQVAEKDTQIVGLKKSIAELDNLKAAKAAKQAKNTVSTEVAGVSVNSSKYWMKADGKKTQWQDPLTREELKIWPGYCLDGCLCHVCVEKCAEPSKVEMQNPLKRAFKKPNLSSLLSADVCIDFCHGGAYMYSRT